MIRRKVTLKLKGDQSLSYRRSGGGGGVNSFCLKFMFTLFLYRVYTGS